MEKGRDYRGEKRNGERGERRRREKGVRENNPNTLKKRGNTGREGIGKKERYRKERENKKES